MKLVNTHTLTAALAIAGLVGLPALPGCTTAPTSPQGKADLRHSSADALAQAQQNDPTLREFIGSSAGYAVFPSIGKGAIGVGGAYGKGDVYQSGTPIGYCDMTQATIGLALG